MKMMKIKLCALSVSLMLSLPAFSSTAKAYLNEGPLTPQKNYQDIVSYMRSVQQRHPSKAQVFQLGQADSGQMIYGIKIGHGALENLVVATHHGNEYGSTEVALGFIESLSNTPIDGQTLYVIPVLNTSGYDRRSRRETTPSNSYDPNRDYPGPCKTTPAFNLKSTTALAAFVQAKNIINVATLHTYSEMVLYPWGLSTDQVDTPYTSLFQEMGREAAQFSNYEVANSTLALYPADGTFEDYAFWTHGVWSLLFEIGSTHYPTPEQIKNMVETNVPGLRRMFEKAPTQRASQHAFEGHCHGLRGTMDLKNE